MEYGSGEVDPSVASMIEQYNLSELILEARLMCSQAQHGKALLFATHCAKEIERANGEHAAELVEPYTILGLAHAGFGRLQKAEKILSLANFIVVKNGDRSSASMKSALYRALGVLYFKKHQYTESLRLLADDVYQSSLAFGPLDVRTAGGYYHMADVFEASGQHATAHEFRCKVSDIWASILSTVLQNADAGKSTSLSLDVLETSDAQVHLTGLLSVYKNAEGAEHRALEGKLCSALATLYSTLNESALVKQYATLAVQLLQASNGQYLEDARLLLTRLEE
eukprot:m.135745 g.135745  ORF g.135745 m.135745 type:complete len:282 (+) comp17565_c0_seq11:100-945(+)